MALTSVGFNDAWIISLKNREKDYFRAANSVLLLPYEQQPSAKEFVENTDEFIRSRLLPKVAEFAKWRGVSCTELLQSHSLFYEYKYIISDYYYFKEYSQQNGDLYPDLTLMSVVQPDKALNALFESAGHLEALYRCEPKDIVNNKLTYYTYISDVLECAASSEMTIIQMDERGIATVQIPLSDNRICRAVHALMQGNYDLVNLNLNGTRFSYDGDSCDIKLRLYFSPRFVDSNLGYGVKSRVGQMIAHFPYCGTVFFNDMKFDFCVGAAVSQALNKRFNQEILPDYIKEQPL